MRSRRLILLALFSAAITACAATSTEPRTDGRSSPVAHECSGYTTPGGECQ